MKLASLKEGGVDGTLVVVSRNLSRAVRVPEIAATLQQALDHWAEAAPKLRAVHEGLEEGAVDAAFPFEPGRVAAPLPRSYQWLDGSAYLHHVALVRRARGAEMPENLLTDPLMYQGGSDAMLGSRDPIAVESDAWGVDLEAELAVITDWVPVGVPAKAAGQHIKLLVLLNDISLRHLIPDELAKGFGFLQSKPPTAFAPVAVTRDELGSAWDGGKAHLTVVSEVRGERLGCPNAGKGMAFDFPTLISHAAKTRPLGAGTIVGSGTVANDAKDVGSSCLSEKRALEIIETGRPVTEFLRFGDTIRIEAFDTGGASVFGAIDQTVIPYEPSP